MLLPAWVSIATVRSQSVMVILNANKIIDPHYAVSCHSAQNQYKKGNIGVYGRVLYC